MRAVITTIRSAANAARGRTMEKLRAKDASRSSTKTRSARGFRKTNLRPRLEGLESRLILSTFKVNTLIDTVAVDLRTGKDSSGHISLRSAIQAANSRSNSDTIVLPGGPIKLTLVGANEDNAATGDLDLKGNVTIKGKGAGSTIIDADSLDRVFQVLSGKVQISGVTIQHGRANEGGGLLNSGGQMTLTSVVVANNLAIGSAGIAGADGAGSVTEGSVGGNGTDGGIALGGGISNHAGSLTLSGTTIALNQAIGGAGGTGGAGGVGRAGDPIGTANGNTAFGGGGGTGGSGGAARGGGVFNAAGETIAVSATTFSTNLSVGGAGGQGGAGASGLGSNGGDGNGTLVGNGGSGNGGAGGTGGTAGSGEGGGLFNFGCRL